MEVSEVELHPEVDTSSDAPDHCQVIFFLFFLGMKAFFFSGFCLYSLGFNCVLCLVAEKMILRKSLNLLLLLIVILLFFLWFT